MTKLAPEWVRTSDPVIRSPGRYCWTTAPACVVIREKQVKLPTHNQNISAILIKTSFPNRSICCMTGLWTEAIMLTYRVIMDCYWWDLHINIYNGAWNSPVSWQIHHGTTWCWFVLYRNTIYWTISMSEMWTLKVLPQTRRRTSTTGSLPPQCCLNSCKMRYISGLSGHRLYILLSNSRPKTHLYAMSDALASMTIQYYLSVVSEWFLIVDIINMTNASVNGINPHDERLTTHISNNRAYIWSYSQFLLPIKDHILTITGYNRVYYNGDVGDLLLIYAFSNTEWKLKAIIDVCISTTRPWTYTSFIQCSHTISKNKFPDFSLTKIALSHR